VAWGTFVLGVTGLILWGEQFASHLFGGRVFSIATIFHTYEAFLAVIHVGILHMYNVIFSPVVFPLSLATLSGSTPAAKLAEENGEFVLQVARGLGIPEASGAECGRGVPRG
jgi:cytochrome b subunit of formate dehydrogenase